MIIFSQGLGLKTSSVCYELIIVINTIIVMIIIMTPEPSHQTHYDGIISHTCQQVNRLRPVPSDSLVNTFAVTQSLITLDLCHLDKLKSFD